MRLPTDSRAGRRSARRGVRKASSRKRLRRCAPPRCGARKKSASSAPHSSASTPPCDLRVVVQRAPARTGRPPSPPRRSSGRPRRTPRAPAAHAASRRRTSRTARASRTARSRRAGSCPAPAPPARSAAISACAVGSCCATGALRPGRDHFAVAHDARRRPAPRRPQRAAAPAPAPARMKPASSMRALTCCSSGMGRGCCMAPSTACLYCCTCCCGVPVGTVHRRRRGARTQPARRHGRSTASSPARRRSATHDQQSEDPEDCAHHRLLHAQPLSIQAASRARPRCPPRRPRCMRGMRLGPVLVELQLAVQLRSTSQLEADDAGQHLERELLAQVAPLLRIGRLVVADQFLEQRVLGRRRPRPARACTVQCTAR